MEDSVDTDWSVVAGKKEKKASPKTHNKKSLKRGELQRSTSSNQLNSRRKLGVTPQNNISTAKGSDGLLSSSQKGVINKKMGNIGDSSTESAPIAHDPIPDIVEDVSLSIKRLSIDNLQMVDRAVDFKSAALRNNDDHVQEIESFSDAEFCELCRNYYSAPPDPVKSFSARGLMNTGSTCYWNSVMQSLFAVEAFQRLLQSMLENLPVVRGTLSESLSGWREVLQLAAEFKSHPGGTVTTVTTTTVHGKVQTIPSYDAITRSSKVSAVAATELMPCLFRTFQDKMDEISGISNHLKVTTIGTSDSAGTGSNAGQQRKVGARKNAQQDAVEFLTFLLDSLHEELVLAEAQQRNLVPSQYSSSEKLVENDRIATRSPFLPNSSPNSVSVEGDGSGVNSGRNSCEMVIALSSQTSLSTNYIPAGVCVASIREERAVTEEEEGGGWNTVSKAASKAKVKAVVVDAESRKRAATASNASVISRLFHGTLRSEVVYKAKKTNSVTFQQFHCLTLDVANARGGVGSTSIDSCLSSYFAEELIDDGKVRKHLKLDNLPEVLILQLGRFSYDYCKGIPTKIQKCVEYPALLTLPASGLSEDLQTRCSPRQQQHRNANLCSTQHQYQLQAIVLHHGKKATGGHYSAITRESVRNATTSDTSSAASATSSAVPAPAPAPSSGQSSAAPPGTVNKNLNTSGSVGDVKSSKTRSLAVNPSPAAPAVQKIQQASTAGGRAGGGGGGGGGDAVVHDLRSRSVWRSINDSKISIISEAQALSAQDTVYILFYGRIH